MSQSNNLSIVHDRSEDVGHSTDSLGAASYLDGKHEGKAYNVKYRQHDHIHELGLLGGEVAPSIRTICRRYVATTTTTSTTTTPSITTTPHPLVADVTSTRVLLLALCHGVSAGLVDSNGRPRGRGEINQSYTKRFYKASQVSLLKLNK